MKLGVILFAAAFLGAFARAAEPPATPKHPVTQTYHGIAVVDDYQWLENFDDPAVKEWNAAENRYTRAYLDKLPERRAIEKRLRKLYGAVSANYSDVQHRTNGLFAMKFKPPAQQPWLVMLKSPENLASERVVLDPNKIGAKGSTAIDFAVASHNGEFVAVSLSEHGSEDGTLSIYNVETGRPLADKIPRVQYPTGGGSVAWNRDDTGVYYTRYPDPGQRAAADEHFYQQLYFHKIGTPRETDTHELGADFPRIAEIVLDSSEDGRWVLATVANGDGGEYAHYLKGEGGKWVQLTHFADQVKDIEFGRDGNLYLLSREDAPHGKILRLPLDHPDLPTAQEIVPPSDGVIQSYALGTSSLYVQDLVGGPSQIRYFDLTRHTLEQIPLKPVSAVQQVVALGGNELFFKEVTYISPYTWMTFTPGGEPKPTALAGKSPASFADMEVVREFATSKDGTRIPLNIIRRKGTKLDGNNPTLLYGYGGYGISLSPSFSVARRVWFDQGGVYVQANLRGGGEFGEAWHKAGNLTNKQNVFDDFAACAEYLIKRGYTRPAKLAAEGASNGGLLMGAFLTQHPELVRAVVSRVGIYDSLRSELEPNGAFNVTEFGTVKNEDQFQALLGYSPYHHVTDGTEYPAILFMTGDHDGRVNPYHSRKMTARLQAAAKPGRPIYLRTTANAGHGMGTALNERIAEDADAYAFLFDQLKLDSR